MSHSCQSHRHGSIAFVEKVVLVYLLIVVALVASAVSDGLKAEALCQEHDETFIEVDDGKALCSHDDGTIVRR